MRISAATIVALLLGILSGPSLSGGAASAQQPPGDETRIEAAREIMESSRWAALVTLAESGAPHARTMDPFPPDSQFVIWMGTNRLSRKVAEIRRDPRVLVYYQDPGGAGYVTIAGSARLVDDPVEKERRWKSEWEAFYPDREETYLLIAVTPERLEVVNYRAGVAGDSASWGVPAVEFERQ
jgi:general stress protein 26